MAVPFAFPEENNDVEVIIRQLSLLLNRLAVEFKKQRNENIQLRARNKIQSRTEPPPVQQPSADIATNATTVGDTLLNAIAACKRFATPDGRVISVPRRDFDDAKNDSPAQSFDKTELCRTDSSTDLTEAEEEQIPSPSLSTSSSQSQRLWWSWLAPDTLTRNPFWTTAVICMVGWHLLR